MDDAAAILNWNGAPQGKSRFWRELPSPTAGFRKETLQIDPSGALLILSQDATSFTRFSITPSPETSIATLFGGGR